MPRKRTPQLPDRISAHLRDYLTARIAADGRPVSEIAQAVGLNAEAVRQILRGYRGDPRYSTVVRLVQEVGGRLADLDPH